MKAVATASSSLLTRLSTMASTSASSRIASSSRLVVSRHFSSSRSLAEEDHDDDAPPPLGPSSNQALANLVRDSGRSTPSQPRGPLHSGGGFTRLGGGLTSGFEVSTPQAQLNKIGKIPVHGQYYAPTSLSYDSLSLDKESPSYPARPLLGPSKFISQKIDQIYKLGINPAKPSLADDSYKNANLLSEYVSEMGKILPRKETRLTKGSQRRVGKAIRRAKSMGLLPTLASGRRAWRQNAVPRTWV